MKIPFVLAAAMALATPVTFAEEKKPDEPAAKAEAAKTHSKHSTSDRQVAKQLQATGSGTATLGAANKPEVRDWSKIDTNKDSLISPEEMQQYLEAAWTAQKK
jgi:hypothetical protein